MGSGMTPMMFPGVHHYMSRMGMAMAPPALSSIHNPMHLPHVPVVDQSMLVAPSTDQSVLSQNPAFNPLNYQNQMQNTSFPEQYARFMGFHSMQTMPRVIVPLQFSLFYQFLAFFFVMLMFSLTPSQCLRLKSFFIFFFFVLVVRFCSR